MNNQQKITFLRIFIFCDKPVIKITFLFLRYCRLALNMENNTDLIYIPKPNPDAEVRLLCFPYAGGNSSTYRQWVKKLHPSVELALVQLPGRTMRYSEPLYVSMNELIDDLTNVLSCLSTKDLILFGHSMGATVAYELALRLHSIGCVLPIHILCSASKAPHVKKNQIKYSSLDDDAFLDKVISMGGLSEEILNNKGLLDLIIPILKADFNLIENYTRDYYYRLPIKVSVLYGTKDVISKTERQSWFELFSKRGHEIAIEGGHFFINQHSQVVVEHINSIINPTTLIK